MLKRLCKGKFHGSRLREPLILDFVFPVSCEALNKLLISLDLSFLIVDVVKFKITKAVEKCFANFII